MRRALLLIVGIGMAAQLPARDVLHDLEGFPSGRSAHCPGRDTSLPLPIAGEPRLQPFTASTSLI